MNEHTFLKLMLNYRHQQINQFFANLPNENRIHTFFYTIPFPLVFCEDGFAMSVQANEYVFCKPRASLAFWNAFEIDYLTEVEPLLLKGNWIEDRNQPMRSTYAFVPIKVITNIIKKHGGLEKKNSFSNPEKVFAYSEDILKMDRKNLGISGDNP